MNLFQLDFKLKHKIYKYQKNTSNLIRYFQMSSIGYLIGFSIFIVVLIVGSFIYFADNFVEPTGTTVAANVVSVPGTGQTKLVCPLGFCATNIYNGEKKCAENLETYQEYSPSIEVCSSGNYCDNPRLPHAQQSDQSTRRDGQCPSGVNCRCFSKQWCPENFVSIFKQTSGDPYTNPYAQSDFKIETKTSYRDNVGRTRTDYPFQLSKGETCSIPTRFIPYIIGDNSASGEPINGDGSITDYNAWNLWFYNKAISNPCTRGRLAIVTVNEPLTSDIIGELPNLEIACIIASPTACPDIGTQKRLPVYDPTSPDGYICRTVRVG